MASPFDAETWAMGHEKLCETRFAEVRGGLAGINRVLWIGLTIILGVTGWSLKTNWDTLNAAAQAKATAASSSQQVIAAVHQDTAPLRGQ